MNNFKKVFRLNREFSPSFFKKKKKTAIGKEKESKERAEKEREGEVSEKNKINHIIGICNTLWFSSSFVFHCSAVSFLFKLCFSLSC